MRKAILSVLILGLCVGFVKGELLSFGDCMKKAAENNPDIQKARRALEAANAKVVQGVSEFLPTVSASAQYTHLSEVPPDINFAALLTPGAAAPQIKGNPLLQYVGQDNYIAGFKVVQPVFAGGRNYSLLMNYRSEKKGKEQALCMVEQKLSVDMVRSYYGVIVARQMKELAQEAIKQLERHLAQVENFKKAGSATEFDYLKAQVRLYSWYPVLAKAEREEKNALRKLNLLLGNDPDSVIEIEGALSESSWRKDLSAKESKEKALAGRPEILLAKTYKDQSRYVVGIKRSALFPQLNLQYTYNLQDQKTDFSFDREYWKNWWDVRLMVYWEIFNSGKTFAQIKESSQQQKSFDIELKAVKDRIAAEVEDSIDHCEETDKNVTLWKKNIELAKRGFEIAQEKFNNGRLTNIDLLDSHVELLNAKTQYIQAVYDSMVAQADFKRITMDTNKN